jgi:CheY-like chemotaxis protein
VALAKTAAEAMEMMDDAQFLEFDFDGLIVNDRLPDGSGWSVIREFKQQYPAVPVVLLSDTEDLALSLWTRARSIPVVASAELPSLTMWVDRVRASVA